MTSLSSDNQMLLNLFSKWSNWADLVIRIDKCHTFGIRKTSAQSTQYQPYLIINNQQIPTVPNEGSFTYLGKQFNFNMSNRSIKEKVMKDLECHIGTINDLPIKSVDKIRIVNRYVYSKIKWWMSIYNLGITLVKQNCDSLVTRYFRIWLNMHPGANVTHLKLPYGKLGLNIQLPSDVYTSCQTSKRHILSASKDNDIQSIYHDTRFNHIASDEVVEKTKSSTNANKKEACKQLQKKTLIESTWNEFLKLKKESIIVKFVTENVTQKRIKSWQKVVEKLPQSISNFCRRFLILSLATKSNLKLWNYSPSDICTLCNEKKETLHHITSNCSSAASQGGYTWRHNSVIFTIMSHLAELVTENCTLYADIEGFKNPSSLFESVRPDIVLIINNVYHIVELAVCFETNLLKSHDYKAMKYKNIGEEVINKNVIIKLYPVEFSCLGFTSNNLTSFTSLLRSNNIKVKRL